jgi:hypothetical protein
MMLGSMEEDILSKVESLEGMANIFSAVDLRNNDWEQ